MPPFNSKQSKIPIQSNFFLFSRFEAEAPRASVKNSCVGVGGSLKESKLGYFLSALLQFQAMTSNSIRNLESLAFFQRQLLFFIFG